MIYFLFCLTAGDVFITHQYFSMEFMYYGISHGFGISENVTIIILIIQLLMMYGGIT